MSNLCVAVSSMTNAEDFLRQGPAAALRRLHALGITWVEVSQHIRFDETTIPEFAQTCRALNMGVCALSVRFDGTQPGFLPPLLWQGKPLYTLSAEKDFDRIVVLCQQLGCRYVRFAGLPGDRLMCKEDLLAYLELLETTAGRFAQNQITLCMHNHAEEFMSVEGRFLLDWAMELAPHLSMELDVLNALTSGVDPQMLLYRYAGRIPLLHVQDCRAVRAGDLPAQLCHAPAGEGEIDWLPLCKAAAKAGAEYLIIEQGKLYDRDPYDCIGSAARSLEQCLLHTANVE